MQPVPSFLIVLNTKSTKTWTDLLWGPLVMGMLCIFVGNVLKFFRKGDAAKLRRRLNIYFKVNLVDTHWRKKEKKKVFRALTWQCWWVWDQSYPANPLTSVSPAFLQGWHQQSQEAGPRRWRTGTTWSFWKVQRHTSTWGDRHSRREGQKLALSPPPIFTAAGMCMVSREMDRVSWAESGEEKWRMATWKTESWRSVHQAMSCHKLINDSSIMVSPQLHRSQALHWVFTSLSVTTETFFCLFWNRTLVWESQDSGSQNIKKSCHKTE